MERKTPAAADLAVQEYLWNRGRITFLFIASVILLVVILSIYIWQYLRMVEIQMAIKKADTESAAIRERMQFLQLRKAELSRLERVELTAQERLGMVQAGKESVIYLPVRAEPR